MKIILVLLLFLMIFSVSAVENSFEVNPIVVKSVVRAGENINIPISVINLGKAQKITISSSLEDFVFIEEDELFLNKGDGGTFNVNLNSLDLDTGVYTGKIFVNGEEDETKIPLILEVESSEILMDSFSEISPRFSKVLPGESFNVDVKVFNLGSRTGEANVKFVIADLDGNVLVSEEQEVVVGNQVQLSKSFAIPVDAEKEDYVFSILVYSGKSVGTSTLLFSIVEDVELSLSPPLKNYYLYITSLVIVILIGVFLFFNHYWNRKAMDEAKNWNKKLVNLRKIKLGDVSKAIHKLEYKKRLLEKAYEKGYIKRVSYENGRKKINELVRKLKKRL